MLQKLLEEIRSGGTFETGVLAARLGTTPALVQAMLEHLQRAGQLRPYETCGEACTACSLKQACQSGRPANGVRLWQR
jgi:Mn-dependent DtxR family transcriptional regulator